MKTRANNVDFAEIDKENSLIQEKYEKEQNYQNCYRLQELLSYANNRGDVDFVSADSTKWI